MIRLKTTLEKFPIPYPNIYSTPEVSWPNPLLLPPLALSCPTRV